MSQGRMEQKGPGFKRAYLCSLYPTPNGTGDRRVLDRAGRCALSGSAARYPTRMPKACSIALATPPPSTVVSRSTSVAFDFTSSGA
jgi:hypothetical protein